MRLPGTRLLAIARLFVDPIAVARVLEPLVADWQREWLASDTSTRRAIVRLRGFIAFIRSAAYCSVIDDMPPDVRRHAWTTSAAFVGLGTLVLLIPYASAPTGVMVYLVPSTLALSVPFAVLPLAMLLGTNTNRCNSRRHLVRSTVAMALLVVALQNWITPYANQAFREHMTFRAAERAGKAAMYRPPIRGLRELTLREVFVEGLSSSSAIASPSKVREELFRRITLPLVPVLLALLGWSLARVSKSTGTARLFGWWVFGCVTYGFASSLGMTLEHSWGVPREVAAWLPLALWGGAIVVLMRTTPTAAGGSEDPPLHVQGTTR